METDSDPTAIRLSMDTKATINLGPFSRGGCSRGAKAVKAADHDMMPKEKLVPGGILEPCTGQSFLFLTPSNKTSDFMADGLDLWWVVNQERLSYLKQLVINLDNGPECSGRRSQFLHRMVEFVDRTRLELRLIYYPPYHSKYNSIERYWGGLERSWNGYLLDCVETVLRRAGNVSWKTLRPVIHLMPAVYQKGIKLIGKQKTQLEERLTRSAILPWWDITIHPLTVY